MNMNMISVFCSVAGLILILGFVAQSVFYKTPKKMNNTTAFECGFEGISSSRLPFSIRFFLFIVLFLVFDVETVILIPILSKSLIDMSFNLFFVLIAFLFILFLGLMYEWSAGTLEWK
uniref:NADH-ubiquinone oxidoreductase chain 3 n=1 Tax=Meghimatium bilineatum TaxID=318265 RepID=A0A218KBQ2_9EUPU|nr:NADH dehydrogenase subunit 3 [Meghimatium bilineatum]AKK32355.1 NADH dehydrogenase subunit 3 [Meghimatium bilineatum]